MTNQEPIINNYIQNCSASVSPNSSARNAVFKMWKLGLQYIPVKSGRKIVGLLPRCRVRAAILGGVDRSPAVSDIMIRRPRVVSPETSLYAVLDETPGNSGGCTVVQQRSGRISGVFTPNDAVVAFRSLLGSKTGLIRA